MHLGEPQLPFETSTSFFTVSDTSPEQQLGTLNYIADRPLNMLPIYSNVVRDLVLKELGKFAAKLHLYDMDVRERLPVNVTLRLAAVPAHECLSPGRVTDGTQHPMTFSYQTKNGAKGRAGQRIPPRKPV